MGVTWSVASDPKWPQPMDTVSSPLAGSGGALEATLNLGAVNISVNRVTGGQEAMSSFSPVPILNKHFNK